MTWNTLIGDARQNLANADASLDPPDCRDFPPPPAASTSVGLAITAVGTHRGPGTTAVNQDLSAGGSTPGVAQSDVATKRTDVPLQTGGHDYRRPEGTPGTAGPRLLVSDVTGTGTFGTGIPPVLPQEQQSTGLLGHTTDGASLAPRLSATNGSVGGRSSTSPEIGNATGGRARNAASGALGLRAGGGTGLPAGGGGARHQFDMDLEANRLAYMRHLKVKAR